MKSSDATIPPTLRPNRVWPHSADIVDPGGPAARGWRVVLLVPVSLTVLHVLTACSRGGRPRHFLWPFGHPIWLVRRFRRGGPHVASRDAFCNGLAALRLPYYLTSASD